MTVDTQNFSRVMLMALIFMPSFLFSQEQLTSQMPSGFGITEFQTTENLSSGVLNFSLPIENNIIPVSIGYATTGIRLNQRPGPVGLGWNLNLGGSITRQVQGLPDDHTQGYSGQNTRGTTVTTSPSLSHFKNMVISPGQQEWDTKPDIYSFQFPGGGGSFVIDTNRTPVVLGDGLLKVETVYSGNKYQSFTITDTNGTKYFFDLKENTKTLVDDNEIHDYTLKWHLTKIIYYGTNDEVNFTYSNAAGYEEQSNYGWRRTYNGGSPDQDIESIVQEYFPKQLDAVKYKKTIGGSVHETSELILNYGTRTDLSSRKKLETITYKNNNTTVLTYHFGYSYLGASNAERLMLTSIRKSNLNLYIYQFSYYGEDAGEETLTYYNSVDQDHWGFYNNNTSSSLFTEIGAVRTPNLNRTKANTLKRIYSATGSFQEFEYELNDYRDGGSNVLAGGLRIYKVHQKDGNSTYTKTYNYNQTAASSASSGEIFASPNTVFRFDDTAASPDKVYTENRQFSIEPLTDFQGRHIAYENVQVTNTDGSSIEHKFKTFSDEQSLFGTGNTLNRVVKAYNRTDNAWASSTIINSSNFKGPFGIRNYLGAAVGALEEKVYKDAGDNIVGKEEYNYTARQASTKVLGFNFLRQGHYTLSNDKIDEYWTTVYELGNGYLLNSSIKNTTYHGSSTRTTLITNAYDSDYPLPTIQVVRDLDNLDPEESRISETDYYFRTSGAFSLVNTHNLKTLVKETRQKVGSNVVSKIVNDFNVFNSVLYQSGSEQFVNGNKVGGQSQNMQNGVIIESFDDYSGFSSSIIYDHFNRPVAEVANASRNETAFTSFEQDENSTWVLNGGIYSAIAASGDKAYAPTTAITRPNTPAGDYILSYWVRPNTVSVNILGVSSNVIKRTVSVGNWTYVERDISLTSTGTISVQSSAYLDNVRLYPQDARMTSRTYDPIFGVSSETDETFKSLKYEYDDAGRQTLIKDELDDYLTQNIYEIEDIIEPSLTSLSPPWQGGTYNISVVSNVSWLLSSPQFGWYDNTRSSGEPTDQIEVVIDPNTTGSTRTATINLTKPGSTPKTISISQPSAPANGMFVSYSPDPFNISGGNGDIQITTDSSTSWTATLTFNSGATLSVPGCSVTNSGRAINNCSGSKTITVNDGGSSGSLNYLTITGPNNQTFLITVTH